MNRKRKGIQRHRSLRMDLHIAKEFYSLKYKEYEETKFELKFLKTQVGALREFIIKSYQETHEIDITHSKDFIAPLTHLFRDLDIKILHGRPITIMAPAQYIFWQKQKQEDARRTMAQTFHASKYGCNDTCDFITTNEE